MLSPDGVDVHGPELGVCFILANLNILVAIAKPPKKQVYQIEPRKKLKYFKKLIVDLFVVCCFNILTI